MVHRGGRIEAVENGGDYRIDDRGQPRAGGRQGRLRCRLKTGRLRTQTPARADTNQTECNGERQRDARAAVHRRAVATAAFPEYSSICCSRLCGYEILTSEILPAASTTGDSFGCTNPV